MNNTKDNNFNNQNQNNNDYLFDLCEMFGLTPDFSQETEEEIKKD